MKTFDKIVQPTVKREWFEHFPANRDSKEMSVGSFSGLLWCLPRSKAGHKRNTVHQRSSKEPWETRLACRTLHHLPHVSEHVARVRVTTRRVTESKEVVIDERG